MIDFWEGGENIRSGTDGELVRFDRFSHVKMVLGNLSTSTPLVLAKLESMKAP